MGINTARKKRPVPMQSESMDDDDDDSNDDDVVVASSQKSACHQCVAPVLPVVPVLPALVTEELLYKFLPNYNGMENGFVSSPNLYRFLSL